jgi:hypothetical protein
MFHTLLLLLASEPFAPAQPPVRVWLGSGPMLVVGDPERVYVQTNADGNLVVLQVRADGQVEVLFPEYPASDPFVRAGTYEIRRPSGGAGRGVVVAALSPDPIWFDEFAQNGAWNGTALTGSGANGDSEALLTDLVQRMLGDGSFNYDVVTYTVTPTRSAVAEPGSYTLSPVAECIECLFIQVRRFPHRRRAPVAPPAPPTRAAIALYSVHRPGVALEPLSLTPAPAPARAPAASRSLLLLRVAHSSSPVAVTARGLASPAENSATGALIAVQASSVAPASLVLAGRLIAARPRVSAGAARAATAAAVSSTARAASPTGVGLRAVHTAGWRH